jgi:pyruvate dehydrogenase E1 component alpha subunit
MARYNAEELIAFEDDIAETFNKGLIKAPIHLYSNNEDNMIEVFDMMYEEGDWVCATWRSHYQCLLAGVPKDELKQAILDGKSITLAFPKCKVITSAIVGGIIPIATGIALGLKRSGSKNKVLCFLGDMTAETGVFHESLKYSDNFDLPIEFIIEDNGLSVCTDTMKSWGDNLIDHNSEKVWKYAYTNKYPHAGGGKRVQF